MSEVLSTDSVTTVLTLSLTGMCLTLAKLMSMKLPKASESTKADSYTMDMVECAKCMVNNSAERQHSMVALTPKIKGIRCVEAHSTDPLLILNPLTLCASIFQWQGPLHLGEQVPAKCPFAPQYKQRLSTN